MASLFGQYLAIYSNENLPKILENANIGSAFCAIIQIKPSKVTKIWPNLVTLIPELSLIFLLYTKE